MTIYHIFVYFIFLVFLLHIRNVIYRFIMSATVQNMWFIIIITTLLLVVRQGTSINVSWRNHLFRHPIESQLPQGIANYSHQTYYYKQQVNYTSYVSSNLIVCVWNDNSLVTIKSNKDNL